MRTRRLVRLVDPAEPGFGRRAAAVAALALVAVLCVLAAVGYRAAGGVRGRYWVGVLLLETGRHTAAEGLARDLVADAPDAYGHYRLLATSLRRQGRHAEQLAVYDQAVAAFPELDVAHGHRCWYGALFGDALLALPACDRAVELADEDALGRALFWRAVARDLAGDAAGATSDLEASRSAWASGSPSPPAYREAADRWLAILASGGEPLDEATLERVRGWH